MAPHQNNHSEATPRRTAGTLTNNGTMTNVSNSELFARYLTSTSSSGRNPNLPRAPSLTRPPLNRNSVPNRVPQHRASQQNQSNFVYTSDGRESRASNPSATGGLPQQNINSVYSRTPTSGRMPPIPQSLTSRNNQTGQTLSMTQAFQSLRQYFTESPGVNAAVANNAISRVMRMPQAYTEPMEMDDSDDDDTDECSESLEDNFAASAINATYSAGLYNRSGVNRQTQRNVRRFFDDHPEMVTENDALSHFKCKVVCQLNCRFCDRFLCNRAMKAILLADTKVELYSTDLPPLGRVELVNNDYVTENCKCRIHDVACLGCGNIVGYHVTQPCERCLESCNNGHFWMFQTEGVVGEDRLDQTGTKPLLWAYLPASNMDEPVLVNAGF